MSVQDTRLPPVPQLTPPLKAGLKFQGIDLSQLRFENNWVQWFVQLKAKVDTIDAGIVSLAGLSGVGFGVRLPDGTWTTRSIQGTPPDVTVANGDGVSGNPTINSTGGGGGGGVLTTTVDFGPAPGDTSIITTITSVGITATSKVEAWLFGSTADNNEYEHAVANIRFGVVNIVPTVSFDLVASSDWFLSGTFNVAYRISA
jgi:hypothetical protein